MFQLFLQVAYATSALYPPPPLQKKMFLISSDIDEAKT